MFLMRDIKKVVLSWSLRGIRLSQRFSLRGVQELKVSSEEWKDIRGYEDHYQISSKGRVKSLGRTIYLFDPRHGRMVSRVIKERILQPCKGDNHYISVKLSINNITKTKEIHRLVLENFVGPCPDGLEACHEDGDRWNNSLDNLRWDTRSGNFADKKRHGTDGSGVRNVMHGYKRKIRMEIKSLWDTGHFTTDELESRFGLKKGSVAKIINGKDLRGERKDNKFITAFGETKTQTEWSFLSGLSVQLICYRLNNRGMSAEKALTTPNTKGVCLRRV